jgi:hypothetical protein
MNKTETSAQEMSLREAKEMLLSMSDPHWLLSKLWNGVKTCRCNACYLCAYIILKRDEVEKEQMAVKQAQALIEALNEGGE